MVYAYWFPLQNRLILRTTYFFSGSFHGDEAMYLWHWPIALDPLYGQDLKFSRLLVQLWVNFATYGLVRLCV